MNQAIHTMAKRIAAGLLQVDEQAEPYPRLRCCCGASLELDYSQGDQVVQGRVFVFTGQHKACAKREEHVC